jgi:hypothetical protein
MRTGEGMSLCAQICVSPCFSRARAPACADARLQPRRTTVWLGMAGALIAALVMLVYFLVPRGVILGTPVFAPLGFKRDAVSGDYALHLEIHVPIYNRNYFPVRLQLAGVALDLS